MGCFPIGSATCFNRASSGGCRGRAIKLGDDLEALSLLRPALAGRQARRVRALAAIREDQSGWRPAAIAAVGLQTWRDRVLARNAAGEGAPCGHLNATKRGLFGGGGSVIDHAMSVISCRGGVRAA